MRQTSRERNPSACEAITGFESILSDLRQNLDRSRLRVVGCQRGFLDLAVAKAGTSPAQPGTVVKITHVKSAPASLLRKAGALPALHAVPRVKCLAQLVPNLVVLSGRWRWMAPKVDQVSGGL